jgi:hypothetical protein
MILQKTSFSKGKKRPPEITYWNSYGQTTPMSFTCNEKFEKFRANLLQWWVELQPKWRQDSQLGLGDARVTPADWAVDWSSVAVRGPKGIYQFLTGLGWWYSYTSTNTDIVDPKAHSTWVSFLEDIDWVLDQLTDSSAVSNVSHLYFLL